MSPPRPTPPVTGVPPPRRSRPGRLLQDLLIAFAMACAVGLLIAYASHSALCEPTAVSAIHTVQDCTGRPQPIPPEQRLEHALESL